MVYSEPALWEAAKRAARERLGGHSARAMQLAGQLYRAAGGRYLGRKSKAQQSLTTWTRQDWTTKSGKPSRETGERYLPRRVIEQLTSAEYAATSRAKRQGTKQGKQFVKQPAAIAAKVARLKAQANPRPRKYASAAEKQAAFRARFPTICVRVEPKTAETVQAIADASGRTQQETLLSMLKYAMTNRNWLTLGLTEHKQLPRIEEPRKENPMKRKPSPAQIAARERFAAMARSGAFKKKATKAKAKPKRNPMIISKQADESLSPKGSRGYVRQLLDRYAELGHVVSVKKTRSGSIGIAFDGGRLLTVASARKKLEDFFGITETMKRRSNPRASNPIILVSDKAIATKRKRNPINALSIKYACIMPEPGGMAYGIDERTPVTIRFSASELKRAYKCYLIPANVRESAGYKRLIAKQKEVYMSLAELKQLFRSFV